jgi:hypothetical protein
VETTNAGSVKRPNALKQRPKNQLLIGLFRLIDRKDSKKSESPLASETAELKKL